MKMVFLLSFFFFYLIPIVDLYRAFFIWFFGFCFSLARHFVVIVLLGNPPYCCWWFGFFIFSRLNHTILFGIFPPLQLLPPITLFHDQRGNKGKAVMLIGFPMQSLWEWSFYKCLELDLFRRPKGPTHIFKVAFKF